MLWRYTPFDASTVPVKPIAEMDLNTLAYTRNSEDPPVYSGANDVYTKVHLKL